jgi:cytochrome c biogenesis protein CcmG/thiol:disulfide interchange protein DsbE
MMRIIPLIVVLALLVLGTLGMLRLGETEKQSTLKSDHLAPALAITPLDSFEAPTIESFAGRIILVNFFASWCAPCAAEMDVLATLPQDVEIYGVAWRDNPKKLQKWLSDKADVYDYIGLDEQGKSSILYGITGVPESFLIDKNGAIILHHAGPLTPDVVEKTLLPLIHKGLQS